MSPSVPPPLDRDPAASPELRRAVSLLKESVPEGYDPVANWAGVAAEIKRQQRRSTIELWALLAAALVFGALAAFVRWPRVDTTQSPVGFHDESTDTLGIALGALGLLLAGVALVRWWRSRSS